MGDKRNYGIDLLRIVSMFMVVLIHVLGHGNSILNATMGLTVKGEVAWFFELAGYCAVNCYALISGYVAYNSKQKWRTFISLWFQVVFYCILINVIDIVALIIKTGGFPTFDLSEVVGRIFKMFLPVLTNQYWYFTAYAGLFLCIPILNVVIEHTPRHILKTAIISLVLLLYIGERLFSAFSFGFRDGFSFPWLALVYVIGGYMAKYDSLSRLSVKKSFLYYGICVVATLLARILIELVVYLYKGEVVKGGLEILIIAYTTPTVLFAAMFLLNAFSRMEIGDKETKIISFVSPLSFGVYLIHTHPIVFAKLYNTFTGLADYNTFLMVLGVIGYALAIYLICIIIDLLRKLLFRLLKIRDLSIWVEKTVGNILQKIAPLIGIAPAEEIEQKHNEITNEQKEIENENSIFNG